MKQYLLDFLKKAVDMEWDRLPNVVFMRHLRDQLEEQDAGILLPDRQREIVNTVLASLNINFTALGPECNDEDDKYLLELATLSAQCIWKMYDKIVDDLGYDVFVGQIKRFELSLT